MDTYRIDIVSTMNKRSFPSGAGPELLIDVWALTATAILIVVLRVIAKLKIGKFGVDDMIMGLALCLANVGSAMLTVGINLGFGQNEEKLDARVISKIVMFDYLTQAFGFAGGALGRISFIIFIIGLLSSRQWHRVVFWGLIGLQLVVNSMLIIIIFVQCPGLESAIWGHDKGKCWSTKVQAYYGYFQGAFNATTDLYLAIFPTAILWTLNLKLRVKLGLIALLGLGVFSMVAAIIKTVETRVFASYVIDTTNATVNYDRWLYVETYSVIITASIPPIRSLLGSMQASSRRDAHELSSPRVATSSGYARRSRKRDISPDRKHMLNLSGEDVNSFPQ